MNERLSPSPRRSVLDDFVRRLQAFGESGGRYLLGLAPLWILAVPQPAPFPIWRVSAYLLLTPMVLLAGALGGGTPGALATGIALFCGWVLMKSEPTVGWQALIFLAIGAGAAVFGELLRRS